MRHEILQASVQEYSEAAAVNNHKAKLAVIDHCRCEGYVHNGWFIYSEPSKRYFYKTKTVDRFIKLGGKSN